MGQIAVWAALKTPPEAESAPRLRRWLGVLVGALLLVAVIFQWLGLDRGVMPIAPAAGEVAPFARGPFVEGASHADPANLPPGIAVRGSFVGGDAFRGTFMTGWYGRTSHVVVMVAGFPSSPGCSLLLEVRLRGGNIVRVPFTDADPGEVWKPWRVSLSPDMEGFRIVAVDGSAGFRGWLAISQPFKPDRRLKLPSQAGRSLVAFVVQGALLGALALSLIDFVSRRFGFAPWLAPVAAGAGVALFGYGAFWLYFASPQLGRIYSWLILAWAAIALIRTRPADGDNGRNAEWCRPLLLAGVVGAGYLALTCLYDGSSYSFLAAYRFLSLPVDNQISALFADKLWNGQAPKNFLGDWLGSDRPPLQSGWLLLTRPVVSGLGFDADTAAGASGVCFQLLWVPALWALLRRTGSSSRQAGAVIAALSFSGFFLIFTVFTWPKLGAASLLLAAFVIWWSEPAESLSRTQCRFAYGGVCAALGWLAHGSVAFSLIGLVPLALATMLRRRDMRRAWLTAAIGFAVVASPWLAYQKFYDPPGNRLLKWHLAGVIPPDSRSFGAALIDSYRAMGWRGALASRWANFQGQWQGNWRDLASLHPREVLVTKRWQQFGFTAYAFGWWLPAVLILPWVVRREYRSDDRFICWIAAWWLAGWLAWIALMFLPSQAILHQGTLLTQLLGFALMAWCALRLHRIAFLACTALEVVLFLISWPPASAVATGAISALAVWVSISAGLILAETILTGSLAAPAKAAKS